MKEKRELVRIVINKDGEISLDSTGRKPGRGAYICRSRTCLETALKEHKIDRGLKTQIDGSLSARLSDELESMPFE
jgi:predicted RNA-binding protein YlxR (DUF448 family)